MMTTSWARVLIGVGLALIFVGLTLFGMSKLTWLGHLPGDLVIRKGNVRFFVPLGTCLLVSLIGTVVLNLLGRR